MENYRNYTDRNIKDNAAKVTSMAALLKSLALVPAGGNYSHMRKQLSRLNVDTSHWLGQGWNLGRERDISEYTTNRSAKISLVRIRGHKCEQCLLDKWINQPIMLELDHIDGNNSNFDPVNLKLLCPNCHSQTHNWRGRALIGRYK